MHTRHKQTAFGANSKRAVAYVQAQAAKVCVFFGSSGRALCTAYFVDMCHMMHSDLGFIRMRDLLIHT